jgi:glycosyltransferase involved in cell wall biosynthesis
VITFVIPSLGRPSLQHALDSLYAQTDPDWKAVVAFDGVVPTIPSTEKISTAVAHPHGEWRAGPVRNKAAEQVRTPWVGCLDDDDSLYPDYVATHKQMVKEYPEADIFSYKMINQDGRTLPDAHALICNHIGISFAFHIRVFQKVRFRQQKCEDLRFLKDARRLGFKLTFVDRLLYKVKQ